MIEVPNKEKVYEHRCFCRPQVLLGIVGLDYYEFKANKPKHYLKFIGDGVVEVMCNNCFRLHRFHLSDLRKKLSEPKIDTKE